MFRLGQFTPQLKLFFHIGRIKEWLDGKNIYPILIEFDLSNSCNHRCNFCTFSYLKDKSTLDKDVAIRVINSLASGGVRAINWTGGGEPLVNKGFKEISEHAHSRGLMQGLFTNGVFMKRDLMASLLNTHTWVRFSIDAGTRATYKKIKCSDDFGRVIGNVKEMVKLKKKINSRTDIGIGFVITPDNYFEINDFSKLIKETGVDYGQYKPTINNCLQSKQLESEWWRKKVKPLLEKVFSVNDKAVVNLYKLNDLIESNFDRPYKICYGHIFCPTIGADGNVWVCTHLRGIRGYSFGNLYKHDFDDIWNSKRRQEVIKRITFSKCQFACKNNEINKVLYRIKHPSENLHCDFL